MRWLVCFTWGTFLLSSPLVASAASPTAAPCSECAAETSACACGGHACSKGCSGLACRIADHCARRKQLHPPGDLGPHYPYEAQPKMYYYFRPYNAMHVWQQQAEAAAWDNDGRLPYSNAFFQGVYENVESAVEAVPNTP